MNLWILIRTGDNRRIEKLNPKVVSDIKNRNTYTHIHVYVYTCISNKKQTLRKINFNTANLAASKESFG